RVLFRSAAGFTLRWRTVTIFHIDLNQDRIELTKALVDIPSPSHHEQDIADAIEQALKPLVDSANVELVRYGNTVCARTNRGLGPRVVLAGHFDTVPIADNVPHRMDDNRSEERRVGKEGRDWREQG